MTAPQSTSANSLPERATKWPPAPFDKAIEAMEVWDSWYVGDQDRLFEHYSSDNAPTRPVEFGNGWRGKVAKFFVGTRSRQQSSKLHMPAPADLARTSADLLFSQPPRFTVGDDDASSKEKAQKRIDKLLGGPETAATFLEVGELQAALGGGYVRLWWDKDVSSKVEVAAVSADAAIPTWRYGRLVAVTFWTVVHTDEKAVYRHLERHSPGKIEHGLFYGTKDTLGTRIALRELPDTAWVTDISEDGIIATGVEGLTAAYAPNVRPNRMWRNTPGLAPLGRSDFDGLEPLFDALDSVYSSWIRDVELGKSRIFIDENMLANRGPGRGAFFDSEQEVFTKIKGLGSMAESGQIHETQFAIRWAEHSNTCAEILNAILRGAGYSASNFSDESLTVTKTATEIESRDRLSERTRDKKIGYWKAALGPLAETMIQLDKVVFGTDFDLSEPPEVQFPVRPQMSQQALAGSLAALQSASGISIEQIVKERNPNWPKDEVDAEVKRIWEDKRREMELNISQGGYGEPGGPGEYEPEGPDDYGEDYEQSDTEE
ncbi:phage portal protein [Gordonia bronchialis]|uniref:phage portal protein n=1 Tax=Gordonia bronchialis TaxID=2054 RepID=UPI001CC030CF|nr:phage portal protein [Gordonia bronchialis]UAK38437.1 phage portal protein [Gordonia bronchialis]